MAEQTLTQSTPATTSAGAQPAFAKARSEICKETPACAPWLLESPLARRAAPDSFAERPLRGAGSLADAEIFACKQYRDDIRAQIMHFFRQQLPAATGKLRALANARRAAARDIMLHFVKVLNECAGRTNDPSLKLRNTTEFAEKHLLAILGWFAIKKTKRSTIHNRLSVLRKVMTLLGRRHLVPGTDELALMIIEHDIPLDFGSRSYTAYAPLAWSAIVDIERVLQRIEKENKHARLLCELCLVFGLRESEALGLHPVESDFGDRLWVGRLTKGKRQRWVAFSDDPAQRARQRDVLDRAKAACDGHPLRPLGFGERDLEPARKYFQSVLAKCGVSQRDLGIKLHGLRHQYAVNRFRELTGLPAPVLRQAPLSAYKSRMALVRKAQKKIAEELGHGRTSIVATYIGSLPTLREEAKQAELAARIIGQHRADLQQLGVASVTLAVRKTAAKRHTCTVYVQPADATRGHAVSLAAQVRESVSAWLRRDVGALLTAAPGQAGTVTISV
jgi:integrase